MQLLTVLAKQWIAHKITQYMTASDCMHGLYECSVDFTLSLLLFQVFITDVYVSFCVAVCTVASLVLDR